jgi:hypothetical protein
VAAFCHVTANGFDKDRVRCCVGSGQGNSLLAI